MHGKQLVGQCEYIKTQVFLLYSCLLMFVSKSYFLLSFVYNLIFGISGTAAVPTSWGDEVKALLTNHNYGDSWVS